MIRMLPISLLLLAYGTLEAGQFCFPNPFEPILLITSGQTTEDIALCCDPGTGWFYLEPGQQYEIDGTFIVDQSLVIDENEIGLHPGSSIVVKPGATLDIRDGSFFGVTDMWDGIDVEPGGTIIMNGGHVCGAVIGVEIQGTATTYADFQIYSSSNMDWVGNWVGIRVMNYRSGPHPGFVQNVFFAGTILPPGGPPGVTHGRAGIQVVDVGNTSTGDGVTIGTTLGNENRFENLPYGVECRNSNVTVRHCDFRQITAPMVQNIGILSYKTSGRYRLNVEDCDFNSYPIGIASEGIADVTCERNIVYESGPDETEVGIFVRDASQDILIDENNLSDFSEYGIYVETVTTQTGTFNISNNTISSNDHSAPEFDLTGVHVTNSGLLQPTIVPSITGNSIGAVQRGIYIQDQKVDIASNTISFSLPAGSTQPAAGIVLVSSDQSSIADNIINGPCTSGLCADPNVRGIQVHNSIETICDGNTVSTSGYGILYGESVYNGNAVCNKFYDCYYGFGFNSLNEDPTLVDNYFGPVFGYWGGATEPSDNEWYPDVSAYRSLTFNGTPGNNIDWSYRTGIDPHFESPATLNHQAGIAAKIIPFSSTPTTPPCGVFGLSDPSSGNDSSLAISTTHLSDENYLDVLLRRLRIGQESIQDHPHPFVNIAYVFFNFWVNGQNDATFNSQVQFDV